MLFVERFQFFSKHDKFDTRSRINDSMLNTQASTDFDSHDTLYEKRNTKNEENESFDASRSLIKLDVNWCISIMKRLISFNRQDR